MAKKFWQSAKSNWKQQAELADRLRQQQMEEEAFGADTGTPSTVSQMLRTGRVLPSQPARNRRPSTGPTPTPGGLGRPPVQRTIPEWRIRQNQRAAAQARATAGLFGGKTLAEQYQTNVIEPSMGLFGNAPSEAEAIERAREAARSRASGMGSIFTQKPTELSPTPEPRTLMAFLNRAKEVGAGQAWSESGQRWRDMPEDFPGQKGLAEALVAPSEIAMNVIPVGKVAQLAGKGAKVLGKAGAQAGKAYGKALVDTAPRLAPERQVMGMAKKAPKPSPVPPAAKAYSAFDSLAQAQRGEPESAMLRIQHSQIAQLYGYAAEHTGDLTNRMAQRPEFFGGGYSAAKEKVAKILRTLEEPYGFEREFKEQISSNLKYWAENGKPKFASADEALNKLKQLGKEYADAHRVLPVVNDAQRTAQEAAIALGEFRFEDAKKALHKLDAVLNKGEDAWNKYALEGFKPTERLNIVQQPQVPLSKAEGAKVIDVYHGTNAPDFGAFNTEGLGTHFTTSPDVANKFAEGAGGRVYPTRISLKNPLRITEHGGTHDVASAALVKSLIDVGALPKGYDDTAFYERIIKRVSNNADADFMAANKKELARIKGILQDKGYDGIVYQNIAEGGGDSYIVFDNKSIVKPTAPSVGALPAAKAGQVKEPWEMTRSEFEAETPRGYRIKQLPAEDIAMAETDGIISLDPNKFFGHGMKDRKDIILHERAHYLEATIAPEYKAKLFDNQTVMSYRGRNINEKLANMIQDNTVPPEVLAEHGLSPKVQQPQVPLSKAEGAGPVIERRPDVGRATDIQRGPAVNIPELEPLAGLTNNLRLADIQRIHSEYGDFGLFVKDVTGNRAYMNASDFLELQKNPLFVQRIRKVGIPFNKGNETFAHIYADEGFMPTLAQDVAQSPKAIGSVESIAGLSLRNNAAVPDSQKQKFIGMITDSKVRQNLQELGIKEISIEPPHTFGLSEQANISRDGTNIRINADAEDPINAILHELGHVKFNRFSKQEQDAMRQAISQSTDPRVQGYLRIGKVDEAIAETLLSPSPEDRIAGPTGARPVAPAAPVSKQPRILSRPFPEGEYPSVEGATFPQREAPLTVEGAGEGAMPPFGQPEPALGGAKPPTAPPSPVPGAVPPARGPKPQNVPQGVTDTLAQAAAIVERDRPGGITRLVDRLPGLRQVQRAFHPSVGMPEHIIKAHIGGGHAEAVVSNRLRAEVTQTVKQLDTAFGRGATSGKDKNLAAFTGPAEKKVPFSGTLYDIMQRPEMYDLPDEQRQLLTAIHAGRSESFNAVKSYYGLKVREFPVPEGAVHLGNVDKTKGALEMAGSEQAAVRRGAAKERFYDTGADRYLHDKAKFPDNPDKWFTPVTDVAALMSRRADQELVTEAGQSVFKAGLGGKTRLEVLQEIDPRLANKMLGLKNRLEKLKGYGKILRDEQAAAIDDFLSGAMEDADLASLHSDLDVKLEPGRYVAKSQAGRTLADVQQEIDSVKAAIAELRPGWRTAKTNPYVMVTEGNLYQYYPASEAPIIRRLTERSNSATLRAFDNLRATAFGGDLSPGSIQGVNSMLLDPLRTGRALFEVGPKRLFSEAAMAADVRANPESWALFTRATGLDPLLGPGAEYTTGFIGKIPKVGKYWNRFNETIYRPTQWAMKKSFDSIYADGVKMGLTSEQAAAIAADDVTKLIPNYSYRRMGMSQAQAAKYRAVLTSVSFLTQPAALMSDATKGILKMGTLQTLSPSEAYAVKRVLTLVAATETIAVASNALYASQNGKDVGQAIKESVSPTSGYFMTAVLPNGSRIGLGGPFRSIIKAVWPAEVKGLPSPVPFAGIVRFARAKVSPALSIVLDLARNRDYFGQKIMQGDFPINALQGLEYAVEGAAPLTIGSAMEQVRRGTPEDIPSQMGSQFLGVNLVDEAPPSVWKAAEETNKVFRKLPFMSKYDINLGSIGSTFDNIVMTPEQRIVRQNTMGAVVTPRMKTFVESPSFAKMNPDDQKVAIDKEMDRIKGMLTKVYNAFGKGEPEPDTTGKLSPTIKDLPAEEVEKHVLEIESLKPYFDIPNQVMVQMGNKKVKLDSGGFTTIKMYMELTDQLERQAEEAAKKAPPDLVARDKNLAAAKGRKAGNVYKTVSAEVTRLKNQYRKDHPKADALLFTWYGLTPKWKYQAKATTQPIVPQTQALATAGR